MSIIMFGARLPPKMLLPGTPRLLRLLMLLVLLLRLAVVLPPEIRSAS